VAYTSARLCAGYRLTTSTAPLIPHIDHVLTTQAVPPSVTGVPHALHTRQRPERALAFLTNTLQPECHVDRKTRVLLPPEVPPYIQYSDAEKRLYQPHEW
jgi:hypothetical protein